MATPNFSHVPVPPIQPLLLVRDATPQGGLALLTEILGREGHHVQQPKRSLQALRGKAALGLGLAQQERLAEAMDGVYAQTRWGDLRETMAARWTPPLIDLLFDYGQAPHHAVREAVFAALADELRDEVDRGLLLTWRAWNLHDQVLRARRPMSLWPAVGAEVLGDVRTFTPVLVRVDEERWQVGWEGDAQRGAPALFASPSPREALERAWGLFSKWYQQEQEATQRHLKATITQAPPLVAGVWIAQLAQEGRLHLGDDVWVESVSHGHIFRMGIPGRGTSVTRLSGFPQAVVSALALAGRFGIAGPPPPGPEEVAAAYLALAEAEGLHKEDRPDPRPLHGKGQGLRLDGGDREARVFLLSAAESYRGQRVVGTVADDGGRGLITLRGGELALTPLVRGKGKRQPLATVSLKGIDISQPAWRRAIAAWAAWAWVKRPRRGRSDRDHVVQH